MKQPKAPKAKIVRKAIRKRKHNPLKTDSADMAKSDVTNLRQALKESGKKRAIRLEEV